MVDLLAHAGGPSLAKATARATQAVETRVGRAWRAWLATLATDADAAMAAAHLYAELPEPVQDAWLEALQQDAAAVGVPTEALYGPLLAVETNPERRARIRAAGGVQLRPLSCIKRALWALGPGGVSVVVLVIPLYLEFVRVLLCRFVRGQGIDWVEQWPIVLEGGAPRAGDQVGDLELRTACPDAAVDELAHAVVAQGRNGGSLPPALIACADLFSPKVCLA